MGIPEHLRTKAIGGAFFHFDVLLGRVAAEKKWSETRVWGSGGGGHVGRRGGNVRPVHIRSAIDLNQEVWLDLSDGSPYCLQMTNMNVQALEGHPLTVVLVRTRSKEQGRVGLVCNLATGTQFDDPALCLYLAKTYASSPLTAAALSLLAVLVAGGIMWSGMWLIGFLALIPGFALARNIAQAQVEDRAQSIRRHLTVVNKWIVENLVLNANAEGATVVDGDKAPELQAEMIEYRQR